MGTFSATPQDIQRRWWLIDASDKTLGRLSTQIATLLQGKHKATYTRHMDMGDAVVVINAEKVAVTGKKESKPYYRHTGYPGGIKCQTLRELRETHPERILEAAIKGMLPKGPLGRDMFRKLHVYAGTEHKHSAQKPEVYDTK